VSVMFVCAKQDEDAWPEGQHQTSFAMRPCSRCEQFAVAGYICDTCGHEDLDPTDRLVGHGPGKCAQKGAA
jgi:hypothetical protein